MNTFYIFMKGLATGSLLGYGLYQAMMYPGPKDAAFGMVTGLCLYAIWFAQEKDVSIQARELMTKLAQKNGEYD
jgi:hypothetical protein